MEVYKFTGLEGERLDWFEGMIVRADFYFAYPHQLNDPFECRPRFVASKITDPELLKFRARTFLRRQGVSIGEIKRRLKRPLSEVVRLMREAYRSPDGQQRRVQLFCVTSTRSHPLLWAHYANGHRGVCAHLDPQNIPYEPTKVHYEADYPVIPLLDDLDAGEVMRRMLLTKGTEWEYEGEYRAIRYLPVRESLDNPDWTEQLIRATPNAVTGVTLGARISPQHQGAVLDMVRRRAQAIPVWKAEPDEDRFAFNFRLIQ